MDRASCGSDRATSCQRDPGRPAGASAVGGQITITTMPRCASSLAHMWAATLVLAGGAGLASAAPWGLGSCDSGVRAEVG